MAFLVGENADPGPNSDLYARNFVYLTLDGYTSVASGGTAERIYNYISGWNTVATLKFAIYDSSDNFLGESDEVSSSIGTGWAVFANITATIAGSTLYKLASAAPAGYWQPGQFADIPYIARGAMTWPNFPDPHGASGLGTVGRHAIYIDGDVSTGASVPAMATSNQQVIS